MTVIFFVFTSSCKKNEQINDGSKSLLISKIWRYRTLTDTNSDMYNYTACYDDSTIFKTNGEFIYGRCGSLEIGNWKWTEIDKTFELEQTIGGEPIKTSFTILSMNETILKVREEYENSAIYSEYKYSGKIQTFNEWSDFTMVPIFPK